MSFLFVIFTTLEEIMIHTEHIVAKLQLTLAALDAYGYQRLLHREKTFTTALRKIGHTLKLDLLLIIKS